jgi:hypothetical protein
LNLLKISFKRFDVDSGENERASPIRKDNEAFNSRGDRESVVEFAVIRSKDSRQDEVLFHHLPDFELWMFRDWRFLKISAVATGFETRCSFESVENAAS